MKIETKYNIGDLVYPIRNQQNKVHVVCPMCLDKGNITVNNFTRICPECYGQRQYKWLPTQWDVMYVDASRIGKVKVEIFAETKETTYMIEATGIGSGSIWDEDTLFLTSEEAQEECDKRNA